MRNLYLMLVLVSSLLPFATIQAAPADLPETGQTTCYNDAGTVIACAGTGQDGDLKAGVAWPNPRFVVGSGTEADCITDRLTGLMWVREPDNIGRTWADALTHANNLTLCGFSDWRLPNINELESLVNSEAADPEAFLNTQGFSIAGPYCWSWTTWAFNAGFAWVLTIGVPGVNPNNGGVNPANKIIGNAVWPVRAGR